jgi:hypothetical protein
MKTSEISYRVVSCAFLGLELIQTHMTQKPLLWVEVGERVVRERSKTWWGVWVKRGVAPVWVWVSSVKPVWCRQLSLCGAPLGSSPHYAPHSPIICSVTQKTQQPRTSINTGSHLTLSQTHHRNKFQTFQAFRLKLKPPLPSGTRSNENTIQPPRKRLTFAARKCPVLTRLGVVDPPAVSVCHNSGTTLNKHQNTKQRKARCFAQWNN